MTGSHGMFATDPPGSTEALSRGLAKLHQEIVAALAELSTEEFHAPQGGHWSPADHIRHLVTANSALAQGMSAPKLLLALRFGISRRGSRSFAEICRLYQAALEAGGRASGRYDPSRRAIDMEPEQLRSLIMERWSTAGRELERRLASWSERALDRHQAKHPLLGVMTVRELLYFTLYHNAHHARRIVERRAIRS